MPKFVARLAVAAALVSAATFAAASSASAAEAGTAATHAAAQGRLSVVKSAPEVRSAPDSVHPDLGSCGYDAAADVFTCQFLTTSWLVVLCGDGAEAYGEFGPGLYTIASPCDDDYGVYDWAVYSA